MNPRVLYNQYVKLITYLKMIIDMHYITTQARIPLTHKGDVWLIIGKLTEKNSDISDVSDVIKNLYHGNGVIKFKPTDYNNKSIKYNCDIDVKLTDTMFVYLGGQTQYYQVA